jgi:formate C-acetyltransferase
MYEFRSVTERAKKFRDLVRNRVIEIDTERAVNVTEAYKQYANMPPIIRIPMTTHYLCSKMTCRVEDFDLLAGNIGKNMLGSAMWPEWGGDWLWEQLAGESPTTWSLGDDGYYHCDDDELVKIIMTKEEIDTFMSLREFWEDRTFPSKMNSFYPDGWDVLAQMGVSYGPGTGPGEKIGCLPTGHVIAGYEKIVNVGYGAIRKQAQDWIDAHIGNLMGEDVDKYMFYKSAVITCDAAIIMIKRFAEAAREKLAECTDEDRKKELTMMAEGLEWISDKPARTFWEALQATIMYQTFLYVESANPCLAFGRVDQYTWPFLEKELDAGTITLDQAQEYIDFFFLRSMCFLRAPDPMRYKVIPGVIYHDVTIGGVNPDTGEDATNPVSYMILESLSRLNLHETVFARFHNNSPQKFWDCAIETSRTVGGLPLYLNDEVIIPSTMKELGFSLRDARDYGCIGCQEIVGNGNDWPAGNGVHTAHDVYNYIKAFTIALNDGTNPYNGASNGIHTGFLYDMKSLDEVKEATRKQIEYFFNWGVSLQNFIEYQSMWYVPQAALSISIEGCMEKGKDVECGGAKYNSFGHTATGLATIADSITAIKYMCFDKKLCTTRELYDAIMANWVGYEQLQQTIINECPHFGNDDPYADVEMKWICDLYYELCGSVYSTRTDIYKAGQYGAGGHVVMGMECIATPDGRCAGTPVADGASPVQGRDRKGPTAIYNSSVTYDHSHMLNGIALNVKIHPTAVNTEEAKQSLSDMTQAYFDNGGMEVQYNIIGSDTMRAAQKEPEKYNDLIVRISGYSAFFNELTVPNQNDLISRTDNAI